MPKQKNEKVASNAATKKTSKETKSIEKHKKSLEERQEAKLKIQHQRQQSKIANGEVEPKNKERFYCKPAEMQAELIKWRDSNIEEEKKRIAAGLPIDYTKRTMSDELCKMLIAIADKLLNRSEFRNYSKELKEDAKGYYFVKLMKSGLRNYNFKFNNPFAYFTTCAWNAYLTTIMKHYKHQNTRRDIMMIMMSQLESYNGIDPHSSLRNYIKQYLDNTDPGNPNE